MDETQRLRDALRLALSWLSLNEPGDSRAVSDEFVAMAAVSCGLGDAASDAVIQNALSKVRA